RSSAFTAASAPTVAEPSAKKPLSARGTAVMEDPSNVAPGVSPVAQSLLQPAGPSEPEPSTRRYTPAPPPQGAVSQPDPSTIRKSSASPTLSDVTAPPIGMSSSALASFSATGSGVHAPPVALPPNAQALSTANVRPSESISIQAPARHPGRLRFAISV